ncbi:MAG: OmpP1/FadL family transporter [Cetobacterium sp.]
MKLEKKIMIISLLSSTSLFAGSIDYLSQQDAEYLAHPSMVGKIGVSGAYYNPAGLIWLEDGLYVQINNQTHLKNYSMNYVDSDGNKSEFKSDKASPVVPSLQIVKKYSDTAYFFNMGAIGGGGSVAYGGGIASFSQLAESSETLKKINTKFIGGSTIDGQSYYVGLQGGIAKKFNEAWSGAVGIRLVNAEKKFKGSGNFKYNKEVVEIITGEKTTGKTTFDIDSERTAFGITGILGLNYHPNEKLNLAVRYETETELDFDNKESKLRKGFRETSGSNLIGDAFYNTMKNETAIRQWMSEGSGRRNLPAVLALGGSYKATDKTTLLASGNYYFIKEAGDDVGNFDNYDNGYEVSVGLDYELNEKWTLMTGYQYTNTGANEATYTDTDYVLDADMYSTGVKYKYSSQLDLMATYSHIQYKTDKSIKGIEYKKCVDAFGLSATYKF